MNSMKTILSTAFLVLAFGCATGPKSEHFSQIPAAAQPAAIDGIWKNPGNVRFQIEKGRMYSLDFGRGKGFSVQKGAVVAKQIQRAEAGRFQCLRECHNSLTWEVSYVRGEIRIVSGESIVITGGIGPADGKPLPDAFFSKVLVSDADLYRRELAQIAPAGVTTVGSDVGDGKNRIVDPDKVKKYTSTELPISNEDFEILGRKVNILIAPFKMEDLTSEMNKFEREIAALPSAPAALARANQKELSRGQGSDAVTITLQKVNDGVVQVFVERNDAEKVYLKGPEMKGSAIPFSFIQLNEERKEYSFKGGKWLMQTYEMVDAPTP